MDTDKYEGCSKTAWRCVGQPYTELVDAMMEINRNGPDSCTPADLELWADAPLLLEEVKRLRRDRDLLWDAIRLSGTGGHQEEEIAVWHEKLLNMNEAELKEAFKGHYEDGD